MSLIQAWAQEVRGILDEMDPTGVYHQRFEVALPSNLFVLSASPGREQEGFLRDRLARLTEIMQESER